MTQTTTTYEIDFPLTKRQILERLVKAGHISFEEMWTLAEENIENHYHYPPVYDYPNFTINS